MTEGGGCDPTVSVVSKNKSKLCQNINFKHKNVCVNKCVKTKYFWINKCVEKVLIKPIVSKQVFLIPKQVFQSDSSKAKMGQARFRLQRGWATPRTDRAYGV